MTYAYLLREVIMKVIRVIQPHEFGDDFEFSEGKWKVRFPLQSEPKYKLSGVENNAIVLDVTETINLDKTKLYAYIMIQDDEQAKVFLYRYPAGTEFDHATATEVGAVDMVEINALVDDIAITDAIIEFTDVHSGNSLVFDTNQFQKVDSLVAGDGVIIVDGSYDFPPPPAEVEFGLALYRSESGGQVTITDAENGETILQFSGYEYTNGTLAELAASRLREEYSGRVEFFSTAEETVVTDNPFFVTGGIGIRNISNRLLMVDVIIREDAVSGDGGPSRFTDSLGNAISFFIGPASGVWEENNSQEVSVHVADYSDNLLQVTPDGLFVDLNSLNGTPTIPQSLEAIEVMDAPVNEGLVHDTMLRRIGDNDPALEIPLVTLVNNRGVVLGSIVKTLEGKISNEPR